MSLSVELELEDGGYVVYNNVASINVEENVEEPSPDEVPEDGDEDREGGSEVDETEVENIES